MRVVESFELTLSGGEPSSSLPSVSKDGALNHSSWADAAPGSVRLLLTFDSADRLHLPQAIVSARFEPASHRFVVLFEDDVRREEVAFPVEFINPDDGRSDPEARAGVVDMVRPFDRIVVIGLSSVPVESAAPRSAEARPDLSPLSPAIVVFGDVPLEVGLAPV